MTVAVVVCRLIITHADYRWRYLDRRYAPLIGAALNGDRTALQTLITSPPRHRFALSRLLGEPLIADRDPVRIAKTRALAQAMPLMELADWYLRSALWWRRALAIRALGLIQSTDHTAVIIAALDDPHSDVRAAALDALADLRDPASLPAIVVRLNDASLHLGRRLAALSTFGEECEPHLLSLAAIDPAHRANFARALSTCATARSRPALCEWAEDQRPDVRAAALNALARPGLDAQAATLAARALDDVDARVRTAAAHALSGWPADEGVARSLVRHLDDEWTVAWRAAQSLRTAGEAGHAALRARASVADLGGLLARQMLWQEAHQ
jgi:HEAT repeat protein